MARCTVERLMRKLGLRGVMHGKVVCTTVGDSKHHAHCTGVNRQFRAQGPSLLWVSDFTYVSTWQGCLYVRVRPAYRGLAGKQLDVNGFRARCAGAISIRAAAERDGSLVRHSDRGSRYINIRYTERLTEACIEPSVGSKGDSYDNALTETINGLYKV